MRSFFFSSRRRHTRLQGDWSSDVCSSDLMLSDGAGAVLLGGPQALPQAPGLRLKLRWTHLRSFAGDYPVCMQLGLTPDRATSHLDFAAWGDAEAAGALSLRQDIRLLPHLLDRKSTRLNSSHLVISYAVF